MGAVSDGCLSLVMESNDDDDDDNDDDDEVVLSACAVEGVSAREDAKEEEGVAAVETVVLNARLRPARLLSRSNSIFLRSCARLSCDLELPNESSDGEEAAELEVPFVWAIDAHDLDDPVEANANERGVSALLGGCIAAALAAMASGAVVVVVVTFCAQDMVNWNRDNRG